MRIRRRRVFEPIVALPADDQPPAEHSCDPYCATWVLAELAELDHEGILPHECSHFFRHAGMCPRKTA